MNEELVLDAREVDWGHDVKLIRLARELEAAGARHGITRSR